MVARTRIAALTVGALALLGGWGSARAVMVIETVTHTAQTPLIQTNFGGTSGVSAAMLSLPKFDPGPGYELQRVEMTFWGEITSQVRMTFFVDNTTIRAVVPDAVVSVVDPFSGQTLTAGANGELDLVFVDSIGLVGPIPPTVRDLPTQSVSAYAPNASPTNPLTYTSPEALAFFTGSGTFQLPVSALASTFYNSSTGNGRATIRTHAVGRVTVKYVYVIPEPATLGMLSLGLVPLIAAAWRSRNRSVG